MSATNDPAAASTRKPTGCFEAISQTQVEALARDKRVILIGEDQAMYRPAACSAKSNPGAFAAPRSPGRVSPDMAIGAAMTSLRPIVDLTIASCMYPRIGPDHQPGQPSCVS